MPEPCQSCPKKEVDWGGCRCQALALSGTADTLDPVCEKSPDHARIQQAAMIESASTAPPPFVYRRPKRASTFADKRAG
jgi:pyrroloquinoline quinone biosynthesis protein E